MSNVFPAEFKLEVAKLLLTQNYTHNEAAKVMNVKPSTINRRVKSLRIEQQGKTPQRKMLA